MISKKNLKNILVNGRVSDASYVRWSKYPNLSKVIGEQYDLIFAQSKKDQADINNLFGKKVYFWELKI